MSDMFCSPYENMYISMEDLSICDPLERIQSFPYSEATDCTTDNENAVLLDEIEQTLDYALNTETFEDSDTDSHKSDVDHINEDVSEDNENGSLCVESGSFKHRHVIPSWMSLISEDEMVDLEYTTLDILSEYIENELENMYMASFEDTLIKDVAELVASQICHTGIFVADDDDELEEFVQNIYKEFRTTHTLFVPRSHPTTFIIEDRANCESYKQSIDAVLELLYQNEGQQYRQRTPEWYEYRAGLITASNLWKIFSGSQAVKNSLIYEKCKPTETNVVSTGVQSQVNTCTAYHWGNKYEPLTIRIYEKKYCTQVAEFGCLRHPKYPFIGASPDGINVCRENPRYGRMIEVKNIFNREITGIPKDEYWVQMQFQMETCGLDECDFIETRFKEYANANEFYMHEFLHDIRGVILYFVDREAAQVGNINPHYVYMPIDHSLEREDVDRWIAETRESMKDKYHLYETQYWYLDEFSCVLVEINKMWIQSVMPKIQEFWEIICKEKETGYEHRSSKKRNKDEAIPTSKKVCLIKLDENGVPR